jgi:hypothetical protein
MAASWDSLCGNMREQVFAALSLLDLGRAAPTCRDFRAAYKARLSAAHAVAVERAVSYFGEAFLRGHSTLIYRVSRGLELFSGTRYRGQDLRFYMSRDGTLSKTCPDPFDGPCPLLVVCWGSYDQKGRSRRGFTVFTELTEHEDPCYFSIYCLKEPGRLRIDVRCGMTQCREAAGAFAAICKYLPAEAGSASRRRRGTALIPPIVLGFRQSSKDVEGAYPSGSDVNGIAAALLPLSHVVEIERASWCFINHYITPPPLINASIWNLQSTCQNN